ncbi:MAG TPA: hypothetical protein VGF18_04985 [Candidatus Tumulicola sp.]|jgi:DNA-binding beta-propeller fold protein YncE
MRNTSTAILAGVSLLACAACAGQGGAPTGFSSGNAVAGTSSLSTYPLGAVNGKSSTPAARPAAARGFMSPDAKSKKLVYVADTFNQEIDIFDRSSKNGKPVGAITSGLSDPAGMAVDKKGNLYVANENFVTSSWSVPMYAPGATTPTKVYATDLSQPTNVAVARDGTIYICNYNFLSNGWVSVYPKGDVTKEYRLSDFGGGAPLSVALDKAGNAYVMYDINAYGNDAVNKYAPNATTGTNLNLEFNSGADIAIDASGDIVLAQQINPSGILVFPPGAVAASRSIQLPTGKQPFAFAVTPNEKQLLAADSFNGEVFALNFQTGQQLRVFATGFGNPGGIALSP